MTKSLADFLWDSVAPKPEEPDPENHEERLQREMHEADPELLDKIYKENYPESDEMREKILEQERERDIHQEQEHQEHFNENQAVPEPRV